MTNAVRTLMLRNLTHLLQIAICFLYDPVSILCYCFGLLHPKICRAFILTYSRRFLLIPPRRSSCPEGRLFLIAAQTDLLKLNRNPWLEYPGAVFQYILIQIGCET